MMASEAKELAVEHAKQWLSHEYPEVDLAIQNAALLGASYAIHERVEVDSRLKDLLSTLGYGLHQHGSNTYSITF